MRQTITRRRAEKEQKAIRKAEKKSAKRGKKLTRVAIQLLKGYRKLDDNGKHAFIALLASKKKIKALDVIALGGVFNKLGKMKSTKVVTPAKPAASRKAA